jgi:hypothetical protein
MLVTRANFKPTAIVIAAIAAFGLSGCPSLPDPSADGGSSISASVAPPGVASGIVTNFDTGSGVPGVGAVAGTATATSGSDGTYILNNLPTGTSTFLVDFSMLGFGAQTRVANPALGTVNALMTPATTTSVASSTGGTVSVAGSTAQVILPSNGYVLNGTTTAASGNISVQVAAYHPGTALDSVPGNFITTVSGQDQSLEMFGAIDVQLFDSLGNRLNLATGSTATIRIPMSSAAPSASFASSINLYYFDSVTGRWIQDGTATLGGTSPNQYYEGQVTHFSSWSAATPLNTVTVNGCVQDTGGARVSGAAITADGITYTSRTYATTDSTGNFAIKVKQNATAAISASTFIGQSNTVSSTNSGSAVTLPSCLVLSSSAAATIRLTWGQAPSDLDSHIFAPDPSGAISHIYYVNRGNFNASPYVALDVDDVTGFGPEVVSVTRLMRNKTYRYFVHNYSQSFAPAMTGSPARVELRVGGATPRTFTPPASEGSNLYWNVFDMRVNDDCSVTVTATGTWSSTQPAAPTAAAATPFCQ